MPDSAFAIAQSGARWKCFGVNLKTLSVGHLFLLFRYSSPFVAESESEAGLEDLLIAVFICSQDWRASERAISAWWRKLFMSIWARLILRMDISEEARKFTAYLAESLSMPALKTQSGAAEEALETKTPVHWRLLAIAMRNLGASRGEAMAMSVSELICIWAAVGEMEGRHEIAWGDRQDRLWQFAQEQERIRLFKPNGTS